MRWKLWNKTNAGNDAVQDESPDTWQRHVATLSKAGIPEPGSAVQGNKPATRAVRRRAILCRFAPLGGVFARRAVHAAGRRKLRRRLL